MKHTLSLSDAFSYGFRSVINHLGTFLIPLFVLITSFLGIFIAGCILIAVPILSMYSYEVALPILLVIVRLVTFPLLRALTAGYVHGLLQWQNTQEFNPKIVFSCLTKIVQLSAATLIYVFCIACGFLLFIIPGVLALVRFQFFLYPMIEENTGIIESFRRSRQLTKDHFWPILGTILLQILLLQIGILTFIGWIITYPASQLAMVYIYRQLIETQKATT